MPVHNKFTDEEITFVRENFADMTLRQIARALGRSEGGVKTWTLRLGLRRNNRFEWTVERIEILTEMYPNNSAKKIGGVLNTDQQVVYAKAEKLGLKKSPEYLEKLNKEMGDQLTRSGTQSRFQKGHKPWCYGKKIGTRGRAGETQFKKGQSPFNKLKVGDIVPVSLPPYLKIKIAEPDKWEILHRHLWKQHYGEIPKDMCIVFKDGNTKNCALENLECLTRAELRRRNSIHNYPVELKEAIQALGRLKRTINRRNKNAEKQN